MSRKGFPESYAGACAVTSRCEVGRADECGLVYLARAYDIVPGEATIVRRPESPSSRGSTC